MALHAPLLKPLQIALNRILELDPEAPRQLARFDHKVIEIRVQPFGLSLYLLLSADGIDLLDEIDTPADTCIAGTPLQLGLMSLAQDGTQKLFSGAVTIEGDIELGQKFQQFLKQIEIDWEEPLSRVTGDAIAHQIGEQTRVIKHWTQESIATFEANLSEYLREETRTLPTRFEVDHFHRGVDTLRLDTDRLEARIQRLREQRTRPEPSND